MAILVTEAFDHVNQHDRTLQALAEARNWKQALVHVEKRLKKTKNDRLLINKALLLIQSGDARNIQQATGLLDETLQSLSPVKESDILHAVEDAAAALDSQVLHSISSAAWEKSLKSRPNDEGLLAELFERKVFAADWDAARKLAMTRMKGQRDWYFRYLLCLHLSTVSKDSQLAANMKTMNVGLLIKSLQKSAADVIPDPDFVADPAGNPSLPGQVKLKNLSSGSKSIETQRELELLVEIFKQHERHTELLPILEDDTRTGLRSRIGNTFGMLKDTIDTLISCKEWLKLWQLCDDLLRPLGETQGQYKYAFGKLADDYGTWQAYLRAGFELSAEMPEKIQESIKLMVALDTSRKSQNASLLAVDHGLQHLDLHAQSGQDVLAKCLQYYSKHSQKPFLLKQLRSCHLLAASQRSSLLSHARVTGQNTIPEDGSKSKNARRAWLYAEINSLKLDYYLVISSRANKQDDLPLLKAYVNTCLELYRIASTVNRDCDTSEVDYETLGAADRRIGDDAAILAALALIHLFFRGDKGAILRAIFVLEALLKQSKHNYDAILLAVRLYVYVGQAGRAVELFSGLDIKNIQNLSTFWIIGYRLSTLHPHPSKRMRCDPGNMLDGAARWIGRSSKSIHNALGECLEEKSYRNFLRTIKAFEASQTSIPHIMVQAERSAVHLFSASPSPIASVAGSFGSSGYPDTRDFGAFPRYDHPSQRSLEERLRPGPLPKVEWCRMQQRLSAIRLLWHGYPIQESDGSDIANLFSEQVDDDALEMTGTEQINNQLSQACFDLSRILCRAKEQGQSSPVNQSMDQAISSLQALCDGLADELGLQAILPAPETSTETWYLALSWATIHEVYQRVYIMRFVIGAIRFFAIAEQEWKIHLSATKNHFSKEAQRIEAAFQKALRTIKTWGRSWQAALKEGETLRMVSNVVVESANSSAALNQLIGDGKDGDVAVMNTSSFAKGLVSGWVDTLDGIADLDDGRI